MQVLAGALKDNKRALIAGERTFGKGLIQTVVELSDGSAVAVTVSRYAFGRCSRCSAGSLPQTATDHIAWVRVLHQFRPTRGDRSAARARCSARLQRPTF